MLAVLADSSAVFRSVPDLFRLLDGRTVALSQLALTVVVTVGAVAFSLLALWWVGDRFWKGAAAGGAAVALAGFVAFLAIYLSDLGGATVVISDPRDAAAVPPEVRVTGTFSRLADDNSIWVAVTPLGLDSEEFFPQNGPAERFFDGTWAASIFVGLADPADYGRRFKIYAILAEGYADEWFRGYLGRGRTTGSFPGVRALPAGSQVTDVVTVTRRRE